jgi:hypothetical protein
VPADLAAAQQAFETAFVKSLTAADPAASWDAAVNDAVAAIVGKVLRDALADATATPAGPAHPREEDRRMTVDEWITKSGSEIEAAAMDWVARTGQKLSAAEAVSRYLATAPGKKAYDEYVKQQAGVVKRHAQARLDPPPEVVAHFTKAGHWPR